MFFSLLSHKSSNTESLNHSNLKTTVDSKTPFEPILKLQTKAVLFFFFFNFKDLHIVYKSFIPLATTFRKVKLLGLPSSHNSSESVDFLTLTFKFKS